jgi:hypothetical protein
VRQSIRLVCVVDQAVHLIAVGKQKGERKRPVSYNNLKPLTRPHI